MMVSEFHFQVVGDLFLEKETLVEQYMPRREMVVNGATVQVELSLFRDPSETTITRGSVDLAEHVDGYIFMYDVSDVESFHSLSTWLRQVDSYSPRQVSITHESNILLAHLPDNEERTVDLEMALRFAESSNMMHFEVNVDMDRIGIQQAIAALVSTKQPDVRIEPTQQPSQLTMLSSKTFHNRSATLASPTPSARKKSTPIYCSYEKEIVKLGKTMMDLSLSTSKLNRILEKIETSESISVNSDSNKLTEQPSADNSRPLFTKFSQVATGGIECCTHASDKIEALLAENTSMKEKITVMMKEVRHQEEFTQTCFAKYEALTNEKTQLLESLRQAEYRAEQKEKELTAANHTLQHQLSQANDRAETAQRQLEELQKEERMPCDHTLHWQVDKEEVLLMSKQLGTGGYATVSVAKFRGLEVAAKRLHGVILNSYNRKMFEREMNIAAQVRHPNLVQFMGAVIDNEPIILTEIMSTSLRDILPKEQEQLTPDQIPLICKDVARALTYLHAMKPHSIIHRDVSSANVLLNPSVDSTWRAKVSDYGSANFTSKVNTGAPGNAAYAAPESLNPKLQSPKMDVFSYGVLLVEVYLREFPDPNSRDEMVYEVGLLYPDIVLLIKNCLHTTPEDRLDMLAVLNKLNKL